jgi:hypothetical protein
MARWEDLAWPLFVGVWALHDHMVEQARANAAEAKLEVLDERLLEIERWLSKQHEQCVQGRDRRAPPNQLELSIITMLDGVNRMRMTIAGLELPEPIGPTEVEAEPEPDNHFDSK